MKPYPVLQALLLLGTTSVYGQIDLSVMDTLSTDSLQKSEIRYFSPGKGGVNRVWNFSQKLGSKVSSQVMFVKDSTGVISIIEPGRNRYYHSTAADFQPYKYNSKELDKMHGLNTYDYGARQHDPILARWDRIDPLCEKYYNVSPYAYCANNPIKNIDPDGRMPTDREAAILSQHVYDGKVELEGGWEMYGERQQMKNGLTYGIYCRDTSEGGTEYVLAFGGTFECSDYGTDIKQAMGLPASQYGMAKELGEKFNSLYEGYERTIVGHSLGGGLCQVASMATGIPAITINSAAVHNNTKNALGISNAPTDQIKNIIVRGDIVTSAQDLSVFANSGLNLVGQRKYIGPREKSYSMIKQFTNHLIKTAKKYLNK